MYNNILNEKYNSHLNKAGILTSVGAEKTMKALGFSISRKKLMALSRQNIIKPAYALKTSSSSKGNRFHYSIDTLLDAIIYKLTLEVSGIDKGIYSKDKNMIFNFVKEEFEDCPAPKYDLHSFAHIKSMSCSAMLLPYTLLPLERLAAMKMMRPTLTKAICAYYFLKHWLEDNDGCYDIVKGWDDIRDLLFSDIAAKRAVLKANRSIKMTRNRRLSCFLIGDVMFQLRPQKNFTLKRELITWLELILTFPSGSTFIAAEAEKALLDQYNFNLNLYGAPISSALTLYHSLT